MTVISEEGKILSLEGPSDSNHKIQKNKTLWWLTALQVTGLILLLMILGYFVVFDNVQKVVESTTSNFHWMYGWGSGLLSFVIAALIARPIYLSIGRAFTWKLRTRDYVIFSICIVSIIGSSYSDRNKFFSKGAGSKELCPALLRGEKPSIKILGQGSDQGEKCIPLSKEEASLALSIDKSIFAKEITPASLMELEALVPYDRGAVAIYIGYAKSGDPKIYDGPDFNPRALGVLKPISEDELIAYKATQRSKLLGIENGKRLEKEAAARAAVELAERQRAAAEAEARRLQQERLVAQAVEERRIQAEKDAKAEAQRVLEEKSKASKTWWTTLFVLVGILVVATVFAGPIGFGLGILMLLIFFSR